MDLGALRCGFGIALAALSGMSFQRTAASSTWQNAGWSSSRACEGVGRFVLHLGSADLAWGRYAKIGISNVPFTPSWLTSGERLPPLMPVLSWRS
jgi:hypothetical protein